MPIGQLNIFGKTKVEQSIERIKTFEPPEGYYLAFSGGKDSVVVKALADMAGVKYDAHYNLTSVDPPDLIYFIKEQHPDVSVDKPRYPDGKQITMWNLILKNKMPPTRNARFCCKHLKETQGNGRFKITGVRQAESVRRAKRGGLEMGVGKRQMNDDPDNPSQEMIHICQQKSQKILNPIIDWTEAEVWEFIKTYDIPYCSLYDEGFKRIGCVGCPMGRENRKRDFARWPAFQRNYIKVFEKMLKAHPEKTWTTGQDVFDWWISR